jgi:hypothetical protein
MDVAEELVCHERSGHEQDQADEHVAAPAGRHEQHRQEGAEEQERRAEVVEADDDEHDRREQGEHRQEVRQRRDRQEPEPDPRARQQGPRLGEVPGDEDDEDDLQQLSGLHAHRPEVDPQARAVDRVAEEQRRGQKTDPDRGPRVLVVAQDPVVAEADGDREHRQDADGHPQHLRGRHPELEAEEVGPGQVLRHPVQHDDADRAHGAHGRQEELVAAMTGRD